MPSDAESTRTRIVRAATRLFAESGIKATTVARIEAEVGLRPGSGGVHRHFATKDNLVQAVFDEQWKTAADQQAAAEALGPIDPTDPEPWLQAFAIYVLDGSELHREASLIAWREGAALFERYPELRQRNTRLLLGPIIDEVTRMAAARGEDVDAEAAAYLLLAPLLHHKMSSWLVGDTMLGLSDERVARAWARDQALLLFGRSGPAA